MRRPHGSVPLLAALFAASGAAGLVHEVAWARALGQSLGTSLQSLTAVLVAFLGGLGIGAAVAGRRSGRLSSPLRAYALLEIGIGLYAAASPAVAAAVRSALERIGPGLAAPPSLAAARLLLAVAALAPATLMMGATFPCLVREATARRGAAPHGAVALLYGVNTLGAALGAVAGSFALLPLIGTRATFLAAGVINLAVGVAALALSRPGTTPSMAAGIPRPLASREPPVASGTPPPREPWTGSLRLAVSGAAVSGAVGAVLQIGWTRMASLAYGSSIYALGIALAAYVLGLGAGPLAVRARLARPGSGLGLAALASAAAGAASLLLVPLLGDLPLLAAGISGRLGERPIAMLGAQFALLAALLVVPSIAQGAVFPSLVMMAGESIAAERRAALAYAGSAWGSVAGSLLAGFLLLPVLGTRGALLAASLAAVALAAALLLARGRRRAILPAACLAAGSAVLALACARLSWDPDVVAGGGALYGPIYRAASGERGGLREAMRRRGSILFYADGAEGLVTVRRAPSGSLSLQINGKTEASTGADMATQLLASHLPLLLRPRARDVLIIGLASGVTLGAAETHPVAAIETIEIVPAVIRAARLFDAANAHALDDPRLSIVLDDARSRLLVRPRPFDLIVSQPSNPWVAGVANLFTADFYRLARARLRPGGLFCQWLQAYRLDPRDVRGVVLSFLSVFPEATLWEESAGGGDFFLLGSQTPFSIDPDRLRDPSNRAAWDDLKRGGIDGPADLLARFVAGPAGLRAFARGARPHTDDDLYLETRAPLALFRDTLAGQIAALRRCREPVAALLPAGFAERDPGFARTLADRLRRRDQRIELAEELRQADLWALRDPFLAAGIESLRAGLYGEAIGALVRAAADHPASGACHLLLGEAYRAAGLEEAAAVAYRQAILEDPSLASAWNALGRHLAARGAYPEARRAFEEALARAPGLAAARNNLGAALLSLGDPQAAERALRQALEADPGLASARANLGLLLKRRGDWTGAEREYRAALDLDPLDGDARYDLALLLADTDRRAEAARELERLIAADPHDAQAGEALRRLRAESRAGGPAPAPRR